MSLDQALSAATISRARSPFPVRRRIATHFTGSVDGILVLAAELSGRYKVHELSVDIRDGVPESSMTCTLMVTNDDIEPLLERLRRLPSVVSSELV